MSFYENDICLSLPDQRPITPYYVGRPLFSDEIGPGYDTFRSTYEARAPFVYIGANDGMLHGFNANSGDEEIAYVPHAVFAHLNKLTDPACMHRYDVDGAPTVGDAYGAWSPHPDLRRRLGSA